MRSPVTEHDVSRAPRRMLLVLLGEFPYTERFPRTVSRPENGMSRVLAFAEEADREGFDAVLAVDFLGLKRNPQEFPADGPFRARRMEPLTRLSAIAARTRHIGLLGTFSTEFTEPYNLARQLASLDHLSEGRAGWNIVTSFAGERNFGTELRDPRVRYERAQEHLDVTAALWASWREGAFSESPDGRAVVDFARVIDPEHRGAFFSVQEALDIPTPPQRMPVLMQAGASEPGLRLAARTAELVYVATPEIADGLDYRRRIDRLLGDAGRAPEDLRALPGLRLIIDRDSREARARADRVFSRLDLDLARQGILREVIGLRLDGLELEDPVPLERFPSADEIATGPRRVSRAAIYRGWVADGEARTLRELLLRYASSFGHTVMVGAPEEIAERMTEWFATGACDGFILHRIDGYDLFVDEVLPRLRSAGIVAPPPDPGAAPRMLRERLGTRIGPRYADRAAGSERTAPRDAGSAS